MARWLLVLCVLMANVVAVGLAIAPTIVTFAEVVPKGIDCSSCYSTEIQQVIIRAASAGRSQIIGLIVSYQWLFVLVAFANMAALLSALFIPALTRCPSGTRCRQAGSVPPDLDV